MALSKHLLSPGRKWGAREAGQVVGQAFAPYQGVVGGAFYDPTKAARTAREAANLVNAIAARKARTEKLGGLKPRPTRATVTGGRSTATPTGRP